MLSISEIFYAGFMMLSGNPTEKAMDILLQYPQSIHFDLFSANPSPRAIHYLRDHPERIDWEWIFTNPSEQVVPLLREYIHTHALTSSQWRHLCRYHAQNFPEMFIRLDYAKMRQQWKSMKEELEMAALNPDRLSAISETYGIEFRELLRLCS